MNDVRRVNSGVRQTGRLARRTLSVFAAMIVIGACGKDAEETAQLPPGHPPLASPGQTSGSSATIGGEAKVALDSGNALYRAKAFDLALDQYRRAASLAPAEGAPLFGMFMVASAMNDSTLADSVRTVMRARGQAAPAMTDSALAGVHPGVPPTHPPIPPKTS